MYAKHLIKANYNEATDTEIDALLQKAKANTLLIKQYTMEKVFLLVI